jgi:hypothetical protein
MLGWSVNNDKFWNKFNWNPTTLFSGSIFSNSQFEEKVALVLYDSCIVIVIKQKLST